MKLFVLGDADDVAGFSLAGVAGSACRTRAEVEEALERLPAGPDGPAILLVSRGLASLAAASLESFSARDRAPHVVVLPEGPERPDRTDGREP